MFYWVELMMEISKVLVVGGTSAIAESIGRILSQNRKELYITARNAERLGVIVSDLRLRGASNVVFEQLDFSDIEAPGIVTRAHDALGGLDAVVIAAGLLPDQEVASSDPAMLRLNMSINAVVPMQILDRAALLFEKQGHGQIIAIGSVAGDRGRAMNYAYGAAKGALEIFLSGLRQRLSEHGVNVLLVKPGFVDTPMTAAFRKGPLWASPQRVAKDIVRAMAKGKSVIYTPWYWRWVMLVIRLIPEWMFVRLRF